MTTKYYQKENTLFEQTSIFETNDNPGGNRIMNIACKRSIGFKISDTYIDESVEIFLKLSMKTVQVHLIIGMTLCIKGFMTDGNQLQQESINWEYKVKPQ